MAFALGAMVRTAGQSGIQIKQIDQNQLGSFGESSCYDDGSVTEDLLVTQVQVTAYDYAPSDDETTLYEGALDGEETVEFTSPMGELSITGGTIVASNANYATISGTGDVVLTGKSYTATKTVHSWDNPNAGANDASKIMAYSDITLISSDNVEAVLASCCAHCLRTKTASGKVLIDGQLPGDYVEVLTETDGVQFGHILSMEYTITSKVAADVEILLDDQEAT